MISFQNFKEFVKNNRELHDEFSQKFSNAIEERKIDCEDIERVKELVLTKHGFKHEEFARWCSDTNSHWMDSNFSIDDAVNALSSCCVKGETIISVRNIISGEESIYQIQDFISQFNNKDEEYIESCDTQYEIKAFDYARNEWVYKNVKGLIRKENHYDFLVRFNVDGKKVEVTPDHIMHVISVDTGEHVEIKAIELSRNINKYLFVIDG